MMLYRIFLQGLWVLLFPLFVALLPQALYVKRTTIRLPEASGKKHISLGKHPKSLKLIHYGESTVAGVGINNLNTGLSAQLCQTLHDQLIKENPRQLDCIICGENGIRFKSLNSLIAQETAPLDMAIITMGVNDTTGLTSVKQWHNQIQQCIKTLEKRGAKLIVFMQVPPMGQFPALPKPLKYLLGLRAYMLDIELKRICKNADIVIHVGSRLLVEPDMMAVDGYHPSEKGYELWAKQIAPQILPHLRRTLLSNS